jgi:hypothetical protein
MTRLFQIAEDLASAAATLVCWIEDDCSAADEPSQDQCDAAIEKARAAIVQLDAYRHIQHGQLALLPTCEQSNRLDRALTLGADMAIELRGLLQALRESDPPESDDADLADLLAEWDALFTACNEAQP